MKRSPMILSLSEGIYRYLLYLYPAGHRREYGPRMLQLFHDLSRQTYHRGHAPGVFTLWLRLLPDLGVSAGMEHISELRGNSMRKFCVGSNVNRTAIYSLLVAAVFLALGTLVRATVLGSGGPLWIAVAITVGANLAAATTMEIFAHARGRAIIPMVLFVVSALLPTLWVNDAERWLRANPINSIFIIVAAYWYVSRPGTPDWVVYAVAIVLAAAQIAISF